MLISLKVKLATNIGILYQEKDLFDSNSLRMLYCSFILPYFNDCTEVWGEADSYQDIVSVTEKRTKKNPGKTAKNQPIIWYLICLNPQTWLI